MPAPVPAGAVPVFARKYQTNCQTCHVIFPKLNAHGEAFRLNGYRMPAGHEKEEPVKEKPVDLGSAADKQLWPGVLFPTDIPGTVPLALNVKMASVFAPKQAGVGNSFEFPEEANLFTAGTLGDTFSFLGELTFAERLDSGSDVEIEHVQLHVNAPFGPEHLVNFKIGKFAPDLTDGFQEMWLMTNNGIDTLFSYDPIGFHGTDRLRLLDSATGATIDETTRDYDAWFAQADYVVVPTLQGSVRYENLGVADPQIETLQFLNTNLSWLVRANIKALVEYRTDLQDSRNYSVTGVVRFAF